MPWRRVWQPTPVFLPGESHGQRSPAGYSPRGRKESDTTEQRGTAHTHRMCSSRLHLHLGITKRHWLRAARTSSHREHGALWRRCGPKSGGELLSVQPWGNHFTSLCLRVLSFKTIISNSNIPDGYNSVIYPTNISWPSDTTPNIQDIQMTCMTKSLIWRSQQSRWRQTYEQITKIKG